MRKVINTKLNDFIEEGYDDVSLDYVKSKKKLHEYKDYDNKKVIDNYTYLNFNRNDQWYLYSEIYVFDNEDGSEVANANYGKPSKNSPMKAAVDVRKDKRRIKIASNIYMWIEELTGEKLYPDIPHSKSAEKLWSNPKRKFGFDK